MAARVKRTTCVVFLWIMTFIEHSFDDQFSPIKIRRCNLGSIFSQFDFGLECVSFWCSAILTIISFACVGLEIQRAKTIAAFSRHDPICISYAGHISHLFKITAILIGVFVCFVFVFVYLWTFHFCVCGMDWRGLAWTMCEIGVSILFFQHLNMKCRVFNDRNCYISFTFFTSRHTPKPKPKQRIAHCTYTWSILMNRNKN